MSLVAGRDEVAEEREGSCRASGHGLCRLCEPQMVPSGQRHCYPVFVVSGAQMHLSSGEQASARVQVSAPATDSWAEMDVTSPCRAVSAGLGHFRTPGPLGPLEHMALGPRSETYS